MKNLFYTGLLGISIFTISCGGSKQNKVVSSPHIIIDEPLIIATPLIADLDIDEKKVEGTATMGFTPGMPAPTEECKQSAIGKALIASSSDVLIEPFYIIESTDNSVTVKVQGFPAKYKNFRKDQISMDSLKKIGMVSAAAVSEMNSGDPISSIMKDNSKNQQNQQKGKKVAAALLGVLLGTLTLLLVAVATA